MKNICSNPTPLRQKFIEYLTLNRKVHCYVSFIHSLAKHYRRSPELLGPKEIEHWLYHLIAERKQAPSTIDLAINAVLAFYGKLLQWDIERTQARVADIDAVSVAAQVTIPTPIPVRWNSTRGGSILENER